MTIVKPGEFHKFEAIENTVAYEIYWTELSSLDYSKKKLWWENINAFINCFKKRYIS